MSRYMDTGRRERTYKVPDRLADFLEVDRGWWTAEALANRFDHNQESVERALRTLRTAGLVRSRTVHLAYGPRNSFAMRYEWSTTK